MGFRNKESNGAILRRKIFFSNIDLDSQMHLVKVEKTDQDASANNESGRMAPLPYRQHKYDLRGGISKFISFK